MLPRSAFAPRKKNAPRPAWKVAEAYKQWLRGRACACGGRNPACSGKIQAAHGPHKASKGTGTKCADRYCIPLSEGCHLQTQHKQGWLTFAAKYLGGRDPIALADDYWRAWPGRYYLRAFADHCVRGEWFTPHPDIMAEIEWAIHDNKINPPKLRTHP